MNVKTLKDLLYRICCAGYADRKINFCDEEGSIYTVNHIFVDVNGNVCIKSTDMEFYIYDFSTSNILHRLKYYDADSYVYFLEEDKNGDTHACDIEFLWYNATENDLLIIDCHGK